MESLGGHNDISLDNVGTSHRFISETDHLDSNANDMEMNDMDEKEEQLTKETLLIKLVHQEQSLYNPSNDGYRNCQRKEEKWLEISQQLGWTAAQVKGKWKAMRDQYCRELKRIKYSQKPNIKWKHFKDLEFLRPFALSRSYRPRSDSTTQKPKKPKLHKNLMKSDCDPYLTHAIEEPITIKNEPIDANRSAGVMASISGDLSTVTWSNYLSLTAGISTSTQTHSDSSEHAILSQDQHPNTNDFMFGAFVNSLHQADVQQQLHQHQNHHQQISLNVADSTNLPTAILLSTATSSTATSSTMTTGHQMPAEENEAAVASASVAASSNSESSLHMFLNVETIFEKDLISLVKGNEVLYNNFHEDYRNLKRKREIWRNIAKLLKKTEKQCRQKWKALRDQFIRELKRLKDRDDVEYIPRWKHYDALSFLKQYIRHKSDAATPPQQLLETCELEAGIEEQLNNDSSLDINTTQHKNCALLPLQGLPPLTGPHPTIQQLQKSASQGLHESNSPIRITSTSHRSTASNGHPTDLNDCVGNNFSDMDIGPYMISESSDMNLETSNDLSDMDDECEQDDEDQEDEDQDITLESDDSDQDNEIVQTNPNKAQLQPMSRHLSQQTFHQQPHYQQQQSQLPQHLINNHFNINNNNNNNSHNSNRNMAGLQAHLKQRDQHLLYNHHEHDHEHENDFTDIKLMQNPTKTLNDTLLQHQLTKTATTNTEHSLNAHHHDADNNDDDNDAEEEDHDNMEEEQMKFLLDKKNIHINIHCGSMEKTDFLTATKPTAASNGPASVTTTTSSLANSQTRFNKFEFPSNESHNNRHNSSSNSNCNNNNINNNINNSNSNNNNRTQNCASGSDGTQTSGAYSSKSQMMARTHVAEDDDEIDIFFKAIAMKIRKAHMPPNDFTSLQINLLKVINDHLGNNNF